MISVRVMFKQGVDKYKYEYKLSQKFLKQALNKIFFRGRNYLVLQYWTRGCRQIHELK